MGLWLIVALALAWLAIAGMVIALCVMAGRSDRREEAERGMRRGRGGSDRRLTQRAAARRRRRSAERARDVERDATG
ncbi:MAG TPA: hypothetical protein VMY78_03490 [Solirubrobacteraceae bacterium]|nr:hypothetical protein [Solirubrobacteraceae bacterium]